MARGNLIAQTIAGREAAFQHIRDFLCKRNGTFDHSTDGIGWTLHDSSYAVDEDNISSGDYFVIYSAGESGDEDLYFKFTYSATAGYVGVEGYLSWDNSAHTGVRAYGAPTNLYILDATSGSLYLYASMDYFHIFRYQSSAVYFISGGKYDTAYDDTVGTNASGGATAGTDVTLDVDSVPAAITAGKRFYIRDADNVEIATASAVTGTTITATISNSYAAGFKVSADLGYYVSNDSSGGTFDLVCNRSGILGSVGEAAPSVPTNADPDDLNSEYVAEKLPLTNSGAYYGDFKDMLSISNTGLSQFDTLNDGINDYRHFSAYSGFNVAVLEV